MLLWTGALFMVVEPVMGQVVEPFVYGHSTGLSAVAVVLAAAFWTWLWGPVGLLLSTPLTLCLVVLGRYVERLKFLDIILGNRPALTPQENFYQRMLANDPDEAARQAEDILKDKSLTEYYDEVAIGGLALAQLDVNRGVLEHQRRARIREAVLGVIDDLSDHVDETPGSPSTEEIPQPSTRNIVLCVAGRGSLDEAAAAMLGQLLGSSGNCCTACAQRGRLGGEFVPPRRGGCSYRLPVVPGARQFHQRPISGTPLAPRTADRADFRRLLDAGRR